MFGKIKKFAQRSAFFPQKRRQPRLEAKFESKTCSSKSEVLGDEAKTEDESGGVDVKSLPFQDSVASAAAVTEMKVTCTPEQSAVTVSCDSPIESMSIDMNETRDWLRRERITKAIPLFEEREMDLRHLLALDDDAFNEWVNELPLLNILKRRLRIAIANVKPIPEFTERFEASYLSDVQCFEDEIKCWVQHWDEVTAARNSQLAADMYGDIFTVLEKFLIPQCATETQLLQIGIIGAKTEGDALKKALCLDGVYKGNDYFLKGLELIVVGCDNWLPFLMRVRSGDPEIVLQWLHYGTPIPKGIDDAFFDQLSGDELGPLVYCVMFDVGQQLGALLKAKRIMPSRIFQRQLCLFSKENLPLFWTVIFSAFAKKVLNLEYLELLVPLESNGMLNALLLVHLTVGAYEERETKKQMQAIDTLQALIGFTPEVWKQREIIHKKARGGFNNAFSIGKFVHYVMHALADSRDDVRFPDTLAIINIFME